MQDSLKCGIPMAIAAAMVCNDVAAQEAGKTNLRRKTGLGAALVVRIQSSPDLKTRSKASYRFAFSNMTAATGSVIGNSMEHARIELFCAQSARDPLKCKLIVGVVILDSQTPDSMKGQRECLTLCAEFGVFNLK